MKPGTALDTLPSLAVEKLSAVQRILEAELQLVVELRFDDDRLDEHLPRHAIKVRDHVENAFILAARGDDNERIVGFVGDDRNARIIRR